MVTGLITPSSGSFSFGSTKLQKEHGELMSALYFPECPQICFSSYKTKFSHADVYLRKFQVGLDLYFWSFHIPWINKIPYKYKESSESIYEQLILLNITSNIINLVTHSLLADNHISTPMSKSTALSFSAWALTILNLNKTNFIRNWKIQSSYYTY